MVVVMIISMMLLMIMRYIDPPYQPTMMGNACAFQSLVACEALASRATQVSRLKSWRLNCNTSNISNLPVGIQIRSVSQTLH